MKGKRSINRRLGSDALVEDHQQNLTTRETAAEQPCPPLGNSARFQLVTALLPPCLFDTAQGPDGPFATSIFPGPTSMVAHR